MINTLEAIDIVFEKIKAGPLSSAITGQIRKHKRPVNSNKEDVVINSLPINNLQLQTGVLNVNIFVPDLVVRHGNVQDRQPDHVGLKQLAELAEAELKDVWDDDYTFDVQQQVTIEDEESHSHYINFRLDFLNINI